MTELESEGLSEYLVGTESEEKDRDRSNESAMAKRLSLIEE